MSGHPVPQDMAELMAQAYALEREAVERYGELADVLATHNNPEVAALFRRLASQEALHATEILRTMGWTTAPAPTKLLPDDVPPAPSYDEVHYLMHPWHALQLALVAEQRAHDFFASIAERCKAEDMRNAALRLQAEEAEHITLLRKWLDKVPTPPPGWDDDPDPPRYPH